MQPQRWAAIEALYHAALGKEPSTRLAYVRDACAGDVTLQADVESLLAHTDAEVGSSTRRPEVRKLLEQIVGLPAKEQIADYVFPDAPRFSPLSRLGAGTFGVVFSAFDRERNVVVALKKLLRYDPAHLMRFKREFRALVDVTHPNLVQLYELFGEDRTWFFTMELVPGIDFLSYVRSGSGAVNWARLRESICQLAKGVQALHRAARLHRDLKPSNVLVTTEGRVVILDFGMVKELESPSLPIEQSVALAGSPAYMAPEQAAGGAISEAADWYAVGVMLYQAITGQLPFAGMGLAALEEKQQEDAPRSKDVNREVPEDLDEACRSLLERRPESRGAGVSILLALEKQERSVATQTQERFVGRRRELVLLHERFAALAAGNRQVVLLEGKSGIGKTSLISHYLQELKREDSGTVILRGRCRESESVPYKALDPLADELVRHLGCLPESVAAVLLPRHPELLRRLFPVFGELAASRAYPDRPVTDLDEQQIRRRAFEALCELLGRMADRSPVVVWIDDLQWSDLDSIAFLGELVLPATAPALLLIFSFRAEEAGSSPALRALRGLQQRLTDAHSWLQLEIGGLSEEEGRELVALLPPGTRPVSEERLRAILKESGGSPLFLGELLRFSGSGTGRSGKTETVLISDMIRHRVSTLSSTAREILEGLCVAGEPLTKATLYRMVRGTDEDPARAVGSLMHEHLLRVTGGTGGGKLEPFHDQVREASLSWLSAEELRQWHAHLAEVLEAEAGSDPQRLLQHYRGAGNLAATYQAALAAARTAENAFAFEQAARFYAEALETKQADESGQANLHRKRAEALAKAGRGYEAGQSYLEAARGSRQADSDEMRRFAAEQLIRSGYLDEGMTIFADLLRRSGVYVPNKRIESLIRMLAIRAFIRMRGLRWKERAAAEIPTRVLRKLDLIWSGAMTLSSVDTIFGSYLQALHMLNALRTGEPYRLALSFGFGAFYESMGGTREYEHGRKLITLALEVAERMHDPYLTGIIYGTWGGSDLVGGRVKDGLAHCLTAQAGIAGAHSRAKAWELGTFNMMLIWFLGWGGQIKELSKQMPAILEDARARGDVYAEAAVRCCATSHLVELAADDPEGALIQTAATLQKWRKKFYDLPHFYATLTRIECQLYAGRNEEAREVFLSEWPAMRKSLFARKSQAHKTMLAFAQGRTALAGWLRQPDVHDLQVETEQCAARLAKQRSPWGDAFGRLLRAGVMAGRKRAADAIILLEQAERILRQQDLLLFAAATLRRRGELQGEVGAERIEEADAYMKSENILRPDRMTAMILPGDWI
jgi:hypothetical protein